MAGEKQPQSGEKTRYPGKKLTVCTVAGRCIHSRYCVTNQTDVFRPNVDGRWVEPDSASSEEVIATVMQCPSGALQYESNNPSIPNEKPPTVNTVRTMQDGPYAFRAELDVAGDTSSFRAMLCRCGHSRNKPYCDKSHEKVGFEATGEPPSRVSEPLQVRNGPVSVTPIKNGPLHVTGNLEVCAASGRTVDRTTETHLCRCGKSNDKPFCDGSHARTGFRSDSL